MQTQLASQADMHMKTTRYHHIPVAKFRAQLGREEDKTPNLNLNEKRFDYVKPIESLRGTVSFDKQHERPDLFKSPEFVHEYYLNVDRSSKHLSPNTLLKNAGISCTLDEKLMKLNANL